MEHNRNAFMGTVPTSRKSYGGSKEPNIDKIGIEEVPSRFKLFTVIDVHIVNIWNPKVSAVWRNGNASDYEE